MKSKKRTKKLLANPEKRFVLDSYALIGYLENEPFSDRIQQALYLAKDGTLRLYCHAIHIGEVYYIVLREQGRRIVDQVYATIKSLPLQIVDRIDEKLLLTAAGYKAGYRISYADAFAAALAAGYECPLMTGDPEFKPLEEERRIRVEWLV